MSAREYEQWTQDEVAEWPGASVSFEAGGKHNRAVLTFGDASRFVVYPSTPGGSTRGIYNKIGDVRRELAGMGAVRNERLKSTREPSERNPGAALRQPVAGEAAPVKEDPWLALQALADRPLITAPGAYADIDNDDYHGREICPAPSISSTGLKKLVGGPFQSKGNTPRHYWQGSPLNPDRKPQVQTDALRLGSAFHDALLLPERWADANAYHFLPKGFNRSATKAQAQQIADSLAAEAVGACLISAIEREQISAMVAAMREHPTRDALLSDGKPEMTLAWQDDETGVWLRCRPDWLRNNLSCGINVKTATDASFAGFQADVTKYRYFMSAALELDGIEAVMGKRPPLYVHPVIEKPAKTSDWQPGDYLPVALWTLTDEDLEYGRALNRRAIRTFADCLSADRWPGYADQPEPCGVSGWARKEIDHLIEKEAA